MLHQMLKRETHNEHLAIEKLINFSVITSDSRAYAQCLKKLRGFYLAVESQLLPFRGELSEMGINTSELFQSELLAHDVRFLTSEDPVSGKPCPDIPPLTNLSQVMGLLYVLEGSHLGGQVIFKNIHFKDQSLDKNILKYHQGHGENTGPRWRQFLNILTSYPLNQEEVVSSAKETFSKLHQWLVTHD